MSGPLDPRITMRDALRELVRESPTRWDKPSLFVLRNRLLDRTGSDARPLAEFLIEALRRGWRDRLPGEAMETGRFDATVAPFVLHWSRERFVQPEMARWAVESWAYALGAIDESQLRIAPPPKRESMAAMAARLNAGARTAGVQAAQAAASVVAQAAAGGSGGRAPALPPRATTAAAKPPARPLAGRARPGANTSPPPRYTASSGRLGRSSGRTVPQWIPRALFGTICLMLVTVVGRVALANARGERPAGSSSSSPASAVAAGVGQVPTDSALVGAGRAVPGGVGAPSSIAQAITQTAAAMATAPIPTNSPPNAVGPGAARGVALAQDEVPAMPAAPIPSPAVPTSGRLVAPTLTGGVAIVAPEKPGVPSLTRGLLSTGADSARMVFVQPARRAAGDGRRMANAPTANTPTTFDELRFANGSVMQGRVEVVRSGTVIFRDMRTGLRHEYRKEDIDRVITEFGNVVRFRGADEPAPAPARVAGTAKPAAPVAPRGTRLRDKGVGGRYRIRYAKATAVGSPECTQVWTRPPNAEDLAFVTHMPGADTLSVAFEGGDQFPSNVDPDGYFASTFRIVPDQARTMTALTTRLNGRFMADGGLELTVNIIFYRRLRTGELTCNVTVNAEGRREK